MESIKSESQQITKLKPTQYLILDPNDSARQYEDEIDLLDIFRVLWKKRTKLLMITLIAIFISVLFLFFISATYQSQEIIAPPSVADIGKLMPRPLNKFEITPSDMFDRFSVVASSQVIKKFFFDHYVQKSNLQNSEMTIAFEDFEKRLSAVTLRDKKVGLSSLKLSLEGKNPVQVPKYLKAYISFVNKRVLADFKQDFQANKASLIAQLQSKIQQLRSEEKRKLASSIVNYKNAFNIAKSLGVSKTLPMLLASSGSRSSKSLDILSHLPLYSLGSRYLARKLQELKAIKNVDMNIAKMPGLLAKMDALKSIKIFPEKAKTYTVLAEPLSPAKRIKPKRILIVSLAGILGFFFSILFVLIEDKIRSQSKLSNN